MDYAAVLRMLLSGDPLRLRALNVVASLALPDCWIGAGFVRDAAWDHLHGHRATPITGDVDVLWYEAESFQVDRDRQIEQELCYRMPDLPWSVKNQARMHVRNGDRPYTSVADAMRHWPETATAVAARCKAPDSKTPDSIEINAPYGLDDLFGLRLRPTPAFRTGKLSIFEDRVSSKGWLERYPLLAARGREHSDRAA